MDKAGLVNRALGEETVLYEKSDIKDWKCYLLNMLLSPQETDSCRNGNYV